MNVVKIECARSVDKMKVLRYLESEGVEMKRIVHTPTFIAVVGVFSDEDVTVIAGALDAIEGA